MIFANYFLVFAHLFSQLSLEFFLLNQSTSIVCYFLLAFFLYLLLLKLLFQLFSAALNLSYLGINEIFMSLVVHI